MSPLAMSTRRVYKNSVQGLPVCILCTDSVNNYLPDISYSLFGEHDIFPCTASRWFALLCDVDHICNIMQGKITLGWRS